MVKDHYPEPVKEATNSVLPLWIDAFKVLLELDPGLDVSQNWENLAIRIQIFKVSIKCSNNTEILKAFEIGSGQYSNLISARHDSSSKRFDGNSVEASSCLIPSFSALLSNFQ
jgi:hypothetical protein